jgi:hypothetical protein
VGERFVSARPSQYDAEHGQTDSSAAFSKSRDPPGGHSPGRAGSVPSPPPSPGGERSAGHRGAGVAIRRGHPLAAPGSVTSPPHEIAGHRGAGLAIHRGHSPGRAGKRHVAAARADAGRPGSVTALPATAFLDAIRDPAHERHSASATFDAAAKRVTAGGGRIFGGPLESPGGSKASIRMVRHFAREGKKPFLGGICDS